MNYASFRPSAATVNIDVAATSAAIALGGNSAYRQIRVMNNGTATAWIAFGASDAAATVAASIPVGPGVTEVYTVNDAYAAAIAAGATGKIYFTPGSGV